MNESFKDPTRILAPSNIEDAGIDCSTPINDELSEIENPELLSAIDAARVQGIDARVIIQRTIGDEGYANEEDIIAFTSDFSQYCQVGGDSIVFAVSTDTPRAFDVLTAGRADAPYLSGPETQKLIDEVRSDLQNDGSSFQADAADTIELVLEHVEAHENPVREESTPVVEQPEKANDVNIGDLLVPAGYIGGGLGVVALLGVSGLYVRRRTDYSKAIRKANAEVKSAVTDSTFTGISANEVLSIFREEDAQELRALVKSLEDKTMQYSNDTESIFGEIAAQKKFFRQPEKIRTTYSTRIAPITHELLLQVEAVKIEAERVSGLSTDLPKQIEALAVSNAGIASQLNSLQEAGFDTTYFTDTLKNLALDEQRIQALVEDNYVERPHTLVLALKTELAKLQETLQQLPELQQRLIAMEANTFTLTDAMTARYEELAESVASKKQKFHTDFTQETDEHFNKSQPLLDKIKSNAARIADTHDSKVAEIIYEREILMAETERLLEELQSIDNQIVSTVQNWEIARDSYPSKVAEIDEAIMAFQRFIESYVDDVEIETQNKIDAPIQTIEIIRELGSKDKPQYIEIQSKLTELSNSVASLQNQAQQEREEMVTMRRQIEEAPSLLSSKRGAALNYARSHSGDVSSSVLSGLQTISWNLDGARTRSELRQTLRTVKEIEREIDNYHQKAEEQYRAAEQQRRDEEERRRQAAAAAAASAEAARRRASSSSSSFGTGGGHKFGGFGGGGGGHKSGGF